MIYSTVLFDLDGTLLDTLRDIRDSLNHILTAHGYAPRELDEVRHFVGRGSRELLRRAIPEGDNAPGFDAIVAEYTDWYERHNAIHTAPYPGTQELLRELARREYRLAVVSNKPDANTRALVRKFFGDSVSVAVGDRPGRRPKPAPDAVEAALSELFSEKWESVYVGDSEVDLMTAQNSGLNCISVAWGFRTAEELDEAGAKTVIKTPAELLKLV